MTEHEGLVQAVVRRQASGDLPVAEARQFGRIGLWRAILGYDPQQGVAFSTHAWPCIIRSLASGQDGLAFRPAQWGREERGRGAGRYYTRMKARERQSTSSDASQVREFYKSQSNFPGHFLAFIHHKKNRSTLLRFCFQVTCSFSGGGEFTAGGRLAVSDSKKLARTGARFCLLLLCLWSSPLTPGRRCSSQHSRESGASSAAREPGAGDELGACSQPHVVLDTGFDGLGEAAVELAQGPGLI